MPLTQYFGIMVNAIRPNNSILVKHPGLTRPRKLRIADDHRTWVVSRISKSIYYEGRRTEDVTCVGLVSSKIAFIRKGVL